jgi:hypothetical protein
MRNKSIVRRHASTAILIEALGTTTVRTARMPRASTNAPGKKDIA